MATDSGRPRLTWHEVAWITAIALGVWLGLAFADSATWPVAHECAPPGVILGSGVLATADHEAEDGYFVIETLVRDNPQWAHGPGLAIVTWPRSLPWQTLQGLKGQKVELVIRIQKTRTKGRTER